VNFFSHFDHTEWLLYHEKVTTSKAYLRDTTGVPAVPLLLFGDDLSINHKKGTVMVGPWIEITAPPQTAVMLKLLREKLQQVLVAQNPCRYLLYPLRNLTCKHSIASGTSD
jgi:hypothetical protein